MLIFWLWSSCLVAEKIGGISWCFTSSCRWFSCFCNIFNCNLSFGHHSPRLRISASYSTLLFLFVHKPEWPKLTDPRWNRGFSFRTYFLDVFNYWELRRQDRINLSHVLEKIRLLLLTLLYIFFLKILANTINYPPTITKSDICRVRIKFVLRSPENLASP